MVIEVSDVFPTRFQSGNPPVTKIDRTNSAEMRKVRRRLRARGEIIRVVGPSKSGKSTMCHDTLSDRNLLHIRGGEIKKIEVYFRRINELLGGSYQEGQFTHGAITDECVEQNVTILIDDFHLVHNVTTQNSLIRTFKSFTDQGLSIVLTTVDDDSVLPRLANIGDYDNTTEAVSVPKWSLPDLQKIARFGFDELDIIVPELAIKQLAANAFRNPLLMQQYCRDLCYEFNVEEKPQKPMQLAVTADILRKVITTVAKKSTVAGIGSVERKRGDGIFRLSNGNECTIQELIFFGLHRVNLGQRVTLKTLRAKNSEHLCAEKPSLGDYQNGLKELNLRLSKLNLTHRAKTVGYFGGKLTSLSPFFILYLRWVLAPRLGFHWSIKEIENSE